MLKVFKKTIGVFFVGIGVGMLLVLLLPLRGWLVAIGAILAILGIIWLFC